QPRGLGLGKVAQRVGVLVVGALGGLDRRELDARLGDFGPVDAVAIRVLERGDVHALQGTGERRRAHAARGPARELAQNLGGVRAAAAGCRRPVAAAAPGAQPPAPRAPAPAGGASTATPPTPAPPAMIRAIRLAVAAIARPSHSDPHRAWRRYTGQTADMGE